MSLAASAAAVVVTLAALCGTTRVAAAPTLFDGSVTLLVDMSHVNCALLSTGWRFCPAAVLPVAVTGCSVDRLQCRLSTGCSVDRLQCRLSCCCGGGVVARAPLSLDRSVELVVRRFPPLGRPLPLFVGGDATGFAVAIAVVACWQL